MKDLLGGKGANLAEMANMGIPVPPGFTITTAASVDYLVHSAIPEGLFEAVRESMQWLERGTGKRFGGADNPLLVSVGSGARSSMPGMMDTILNLGLNDETVLALARQSQSERFAFNAYRRLLCMFADVVLGSLDTEGVGELMRIATEKGRVARTEIAIGVCGEHGGGPQVDRVLREHRLELRLLLSVPRADCPGGGRAGAAPSDTGIEVRSSSSLPEHDKQRSS